jgi:hypothetical protein
MKGGCGTFFAISIESDKFKGLSKIKQHQKVNKVLEDEVKTWHGMQVRPISSSMTGLRSPSLTLSDGIYSSRRWLYKAVRS